MPWFPEEDVREAAEAAASRRAWGETHKERARSGGAVSGGRSPSNWLTKILEGETPPLPYKLGVPNRGEARPRAHLPRLATTQRAERVVARDMSLFDSITSLFVPPPPPPPPPIWQQNGPILVAALCCWLVPAVLLVAGLWETRRVHSPDKKVCNHDHTQACTNLRSHTAASH